MSTPLSPEKNYNYASVSCVSAYIYKLVGLVNRRVGAFGKPLGYVVLGLVNLNHNTIIAYHGKEIKY